jgi:hypothetical protein
MMVAIGRAVRTHPVVVVSRMDAQNSVNPADRTTDRAADDSANRACSGTAVRGAPLHSSNNALSMSRSRRHKQSRKRRKSQDLKHVFLYTRAGAHVSLAAEKSMAQS